MASAPVRQASQRRPNQAVTPQSPAISAPTRTSTHTSTIFSQQQDEISQAQEQEQEQERKSPPTRDTEEEEKCWICFSDFSEDVPRAPCPCALRAHEECLLDWIADMEAPKNSRNRSVTAPRIACPQCKAEITLARPTNPIVDLVRSFERIGAKLVTPGAIITLGGVVYSSSMAWGAHSIYAVFGAEDGFRILLPILQNAVRAPVEVYLGTPRKATKQLLGVVLDHLVHWRLYVGLPLITPILIFSRTHFADGILPVLPIVFFASQTPPNGVIDFGQWPPSASFVFALLPYVRSIYNTYYDRVWAARERRWMKEIQPRAGQSENNDGEDTDGADEAGDERREEDGNLFEVMIDAPLWGGDEWGDEVEHNHGGLGAQQQGQQPPLNQGNADALPPDAIDVLHMPQPAQQPAAQPNVQRQPAAQNERRLSFSPAAIAETILGALIFPTIAGLSGEALRLILPSAWTSAAAPSPRFGGRSVPRGLLQQKWGRSIVGGCLFVVCKDALMLYVRYKMSQMHRKRRVIDFDRRKATTRGSP